MLTTNPVATATRPNPKFATQPARVHQRQRRLLDPAQPTADDRR